MPEAVRTCLGYSPFIGYHLHGKGGWVSDVAVLAMGPAGQTRGDPILSRGAGASLRGTRGREASCLHCQASFLAGNEDRALVDLHGNDSGTPSRRPGCRSHSWRKAALGWPVALLAPRGGISRLGLQGAGLGRRGAGVAWTAPFPGSGGTSIPPGPGMRLDPMVSRGHRNPSHRPSSALGRPCGRRGEPPATSPGCLPALDLRGAQLFFLPR